MKPLTVAKLIEHLKTLPQDYTCEENSGYYHYEWMPMYEDDLGRLTRVDDEKRIVRFTNTGS